MDTPVGNGAIDPGLLGHRRRSSDGRSRQNQKHHRRQTPHRRTPPCEVSHDSTSSVPRRKPTAPPAPSPTPTPDLAAYPFIIPKARGNLAIALLVTGQTAEALAAYDAALQIASAKDVTEMAADLDEAVAKHGSVAGADEVRSRIESRRATLQG